MDHKMFEKETEPVFSKKHNFFEELFMKDIDESTMASTEDHVLALQKQNAKLEKLSSVFGMVSFAALIALCVSLNSSGKSNVKIELENNYQEVISQALNLSPNADVDNLAEALDNKLHTKAALTVSDRGEQVLNYRVPSKFYTPGSTVKIEYKNVLTQHDMISFTFPNLNKTGYGVMEKKVLLEKIQERNFPGYIISTNNPKDDEPLIAVFLKNHALDGKSVINLPAPIITTTDIKLPSLEDITKSKILNTTIDNDILSEKLPVLTKEEQEQLLKMRPGDI